MLEKPNKAIIPIYGLNFYNKKTGSYLHAKLRIYGIAKLMNKLLVFPLLMYFTLKYKYLATREIISREI